MLTLPQAVAPALLDLVLQLLIQWLSLPGSTAATVTQAPAGASVAYTFTMRIALVGRRLQAGAADVDALLAAKLDDGSLVAALAESGLAPALGFDSAESLVGAVAALPATLALPSPSSSSVPRAQAAAGLSTAVVAGVAAGAGVVALVVALAAWRAFAQRPRGGAAVLAARVAPEPAAVVAAKADF